MEKFVRDVQRVVLRAWRRERSLATRQVSWVLVSEP